MHKIIDFAQELGVKLYPGQAAALDEYYRSGKQNWLLLAGRRGGKTLLSDIIACYEGTVPDFADVLREGEGRYILIVSVRQDTANLHIKNISNLLRRSSALGKMIKSVYSDRLELTNGVTILSLPASARAGRGYGASTLILDEAAFFQDTAGNSSANAVFEALEPTTATYGARARIIITTSVGARVGLVYDLYSRADELQDWFVTRATSQELNPKISDRTVQNALRKDAESAAAEYLSEFRDPVEAFLSAEAVERAVDPALREATGAQAGRQYLMAIDPALMGDRYAFVIAHKYQGIVTVDYARALRPPVDPNRAEALLFDLVKAFKPTKIFCDTAATTERLRGKLPALVYQPFSRPLKLRIYGSLKEAINLGNLALYPHDDLVDELKALQIRNGADISAPKAGRVKHDDLADCLALVVDGLGGRGVMEACWIPNMFDEGDAPDEEYERWEREHGRPYPRRERKEPVVHLHAEDIWQARRDAIAHQRAQEDSMINHRTVDAFWKNVRGK